MNFLKKNLDILLWLFIIIFVIPLPGQEVGLLGKNDQRDVTMRRPLGKNLSDASKAWHEPTKWFFYLGVPVLIIYNRKRNKEK